MKIGFHTMFSYRQNLIARYCTILDGTTKFQTWKGWHNISTTVIEVIFKLIKLQQQTITWNEMKSNFIVMFWLSYTIVIFVRTSCGVRFKLFHSPLWLLNFPLAHSWPRTLGDSPNNLQRLSIYEKFFYPTSQTKKPESCTLLNHGNHYFF